MKTGKKSLNRFGNYFSAKWVSALLAVFVFVAGMMVSIAEAAADSAGASGSAKVLRMKTLWENVDLNVYSRYNGEYRALGGSQAAETVFGKTSPGKTVKLQIYPENKFKGGTSAIYFGTYKIQKGFPKIASKDYERKTQSQTQSFTIPQGVEMVIAHVYMTWTTGDPKNPLYDDGVATRHYVLFTSDDAFRRAYKIFTGKTLNKIVPPKTNVSQDKTKTKTVTEKDKADSPVIKNGEPSGDDSGGIGIVEIGGGLVLVSIGGYLGLHFLGGGAATGEAGAEAVSDLTSAEPDIPPQPSVPPEPKEYIYTDPAGFQTLYVQDPETGQWTNYETGNPVDMDSLKEYDKQRMQDMAWSHNETKNLADRTTAFDNDLKQDYRNMLEEEARIQQQTKKDMMAIKSGTYGMTDAERQAYLNDRQAKLEAEKEAADKKAARLDTAVKTLEVIEKGADISISVLSTVTPGGKLVANIYTGVKNVTVGGMQAAVDGKSIMGGIVKGAAKGGADILQNMTDKIPAGKWGYKLATYVTSETMKEGIVAYVDGENVVKASVKGMVQGWSKFGVDQIGGALSDKAAANNNLAMKEKYLKIRDNWSKDLKPKSVKAVRTLNFQRYFAKEQSRLINQGLGQTFANEASARAYEMGVEGKSFTESAFGDKW